MKTGLISNDISDHMGNFIILLSNDVKTDQFIAKTSRDFSTKNISNFHNLLDIEDWSNLFILTDVDAAYDLFNDVIMCYYDTSFPRVTHKIRRTEKQWVTLHLIKSINVKCTLYKKWVKSGKSKDEIKYKEYSRDLKKILRKAERDYYSKLFDNKINNTKQYG